MIASPVKTGHARLFHFLLILISSEGLLFLPSLFFISSMNRNSWILGLSLSRWIAILVFCTTLVFLITFTIGSLLDKTWARTIRSRISTFVTEPTRFWQMMFFSMLSVVLGVAFVIAFNTGSIQLKTGLFGVVFFRLQPIIIWGTLSVLEMCGYVVFTIGKNIVAADRKKLIGVILLFSLAAFLSFVYWLTLYLDLPWISGLQYWYWQNVDKGGIYGARFVVLWVLSLLVCYLVYKQVHSTRLGLLILMVFGYLLILGFGYVGGRKGFETIRLTHLGANNQVAYTEFAALDSISPWLVISNYEKLTPPDNIFLKQKPPGTLFVYSIFLQISEEFLQPVNSQSDRVDMLSRVLAVIFPLMTVMALWPLYGIARQFLKDKDALIPCMVYITTPNLLLIPIGLDKALYPTLFLIGILLLFRMERLRSTSSAILMGAYLYIGLFFSFSLLPLLLWTPLWIFVNGWTQNRKTFWTRCIRPLLVLGIAFLVCATLFRLVLHYDFVTRYQVSMEWLREISDFRFTFSYLSAAIFGINVELAAWTGFPLILITLAQIFESLRSALRHQMGYLDLFLIVSVVVYIFLNLFSQLNAEVGRTWIFLEGLIVLFAGYFISRIPKLRGSALLTLVALQLITSYFLIAYQCPCWTPY